MKCPAFLELHVPSGPLPPYFSSAELWLTNPGSMERGQLQSTVQQGQPLCGEQKQPLAWPQADAIAD
jgi:hypothetical protein